MEEFDSTIFDMALTSKRVEKWLKKTKFEESRYIERYNNFRNELSEKQKEELDQIKGSIKDFYEDALLDNLSMFLNLGIKIGMELKETLLRFDDLLLY